MKSRLQQLERHWSEYVPENSPVVAQDVSATNAVGLVDESGVVDGQPVVETTGYAISDEEVRLAAASLLTL